MSELEARRLAVTGPGGMLAAALALAANDEQADEIREHPYLEPGQVIIMSDPQPPPFPRYSVSLSESGPWLPASSVKFTDARSEAAEAAAEAGRNWRRRMNARQRRRR